METIEITELWKIIRQRWIMILSIVVIAVTTSGLLSFFVLKPEYEATTTILVQTQHTNNQVVYNDLIANQKLVKTYGEIIKSRQIAEDVNRQLNLNMTPEQLLGKVQVKAANESLVTSITVTDNNPKQAVLIANGFAKSFATNLNSIMKVDNIAILDEAKFKENMAPVRPKPSLNMAIALVLGVMVGVGLAFLLEFLDKTVKTETQIEELFDLPVLGVIAVMEPKVKKGRRQQEVLTGGVEREIQGKAGQVNLPL